MKRMLLALGFASILYCDVVFSDYVSHAFVDINVEQDQCLQVGIEAAKTIGISNIKVLENRIVYGMDKQGYSLQFTCRAEKGASYYIINGPASKKRGDISVSFYSELNKNLKIVESSQ